MMRPFPTDPGRTLIDVEPTRLRGLPPLVSEVLALIGNPASSVAQLGAVVASDRALSERILRIANSPVLGIPSRVSTVSHAVTLLGFEALRETVMRMVVTGAFRNMVEFFTHYEEFWSHSIACGLFARMLARKQPRVNATDAYVAGLFHDIGMIVPEGVDTPASLRGATDQESGLVAAHHQETGARLALQWGFDERVVEAIRHHHQPAAATLDPHLTSIVHVADVLCRHVPVGRFSADPEPVCDPIALRHLEMSEADVTPENLDQEIAGIVKEMAHAPSFEQLVAAVKQSLVDGISGLPYRERLTLALCYQEGLRVEEVADLMGTTADDIRVLLDRGLSALATLIHSSM